MLNRLLFFILLLHCLSLGEPLDLGTHSPISNRKDPFDLQWRLHGHRCGHQQVLWYEGLQKYFTLFPCEYLRIL